MTPGLLIVGGGLAAQRCCETLRALGHDAPITIVGAERVAPYDRPPLSKELLDGPAEAPWLRPRAWHAEQGVALRLGAAAVRLRAGRRVIELAGGERLRYDDLLIATGSEPVRLPALAGFSNVQALRTFDDAVRLRAALAAGAALTVVGGGLIGLEVASSARRLGAAVTVVEAAPQPLSGLLGPDVGHHLASLHREDGVALRLGVPLASARGGTAGIEEGAPSRGVASGGPLVEELVLADGSRIATDHVVEAVGVRPATGWLAGSGLDPRGVSAGEGGHTALPHVFAAGDVTGSGHWDAAARQGAGVARALLGLTPAPPAPPSFWSDQLGLRLQCVGDPAGARAQLDVDAEGRGFEAVYRREGRVSAVLLAGRSAADLRAARRRLSPAPELERSAA
ncbi:MAG TPA: FAD-dependent oxidoreductase [Solirubrobacteraceae bacterium]|nr:FAD-dependent oxidoreductase [Solirubrobacteraceae bacterium]